LELELALRSLLHGLHPCFERIQDPYVKLFEVALVSRDHDQPVYARSGGNHARGWDDSGFRRIFLGQRGGCRKKADQKCSKKSSHWFSSSNIVEIVPRRRM
jgi:hypothetical protein